MGPAFSSKSTPDRATGAEPSSDTKRPQNSRIVPHPIHSLLELTGPELRKIIAEQESAHPEPRQSALSRVEGYFSRLFRTDHQSHEVPFQTGLRLFSQSLWVLGGALAATVGVSALTSHFGLSVGNASLSTRESGGAPLHWSTAIIFAPVLEEFLFRGIPRAVMNTVKWLAGPSSEKALNTLFGVTSSLAFALAHNLVSPSAAPGIQIADGLMLSLQWIPLPQFLCGLWFWSVARQHGVKGSILAHAMFNASAIGILSALSRLGY